MSETYFGIILFNYNLFTSKLESFISIITDIMLFCESYVEMNK